MSSKPAPSPDILRSQEEAFIQHYKWLIRWALQFTNNDRARAEDLVQEVFAQFAFAHTDLSAVQNIPAYLYTTLRNTHVSEVRIAGRSHLKSLSIVEYSIADAALGASDPCGLYQTQDQLRRICQYACVRKQSSRAGSVLILRFFHGYHLSEVAEVLGGTCQAVRQCLRFARNEARLFLDDPGALKFIDKTQAVNIVSSGTVHSPEELLADLRLAIFRSRQGECLATESLRALYQKGLIVMADNSTLAHVVSCPQCLEGANRELGLPLLADRHPADALGPNNSSRGGPGASGGTGGTGNYLRSRRRARTPEGEISSAFLLRCRRRTRELFEHHPSELCVSVNGHLLGSQSVNSEISRLRLDITIPEPLSFIEVMSEENGRLLVMTIDSPPSGEPTQVRQVALSEGRHIEVTLRYGHPWPMLEVVYQDPNFTAESQLSMSDVDGMWGLNPAKASSAMPVDVEAGACLGPVAGKPPNGTGRLALMPLQSSLLEHLAQTGSVKTLSGLMRRFGRYNFARPSRLILSLSRRKRAGFPMVSRTLLGNASRTCTAEKVTCPPEAQTPQSESTSAALRFSRKRREVAGLFNFSRRVRPLWSRPSFITAIVSMLLISALLFVRLNITPTVSAASLIERATAAEEMLTAGTDQATHRVISLEERAHAGGALIARSRIEIWRDTGKDLSVRRVYDEKGHLIAGEWARSHEEPNKGSDGKSLSLRTIYHRGDAPRIETSPAEPQTALRNFDLWRLEPSAKDYAEMIGRADAARVSEDPVAYVLSYAGQQPAGDTTLLQATLTLRKSDLHPVEQSLIVKRDNETREYRFVEASFERPPVRAVAPEVFELDPELLSERPKDEGGRMKPGGDTLHPSSFVPHPSVVATAELEVEVAYLLDQFRARFGDQINLTRSPAGLLRVDGVVDTEQSKEQVLSALAPVMNKPGVTVQIRTTTEALARQQERRSDRVMVREFSGSADATPLYSELRRYFSRRGDAQGQEKTAGLLPEDDRTDQAVRAFSARVVGRSRRALSHAIELKQLSERFSVTQLDALTPNARAKLFGMVRDHAAALKREASGLRGELQPIFFPSENASAERGIEISSDAGLAVAIERLYKLVLANDEAVRSAFTASSDASTGHAVKAPQFRLSLAMAEGLADRIRETAAKE